MIRKISSSCIMLLLGFLFFPARSSAQLQVTTAYPLSYLVNEVFLGKGVQVKSFNFKGTSQQIGYFYGKFSNIGIDSGILLSTGRVTDARGPNNSSSTSGAFDGPGDAQLLAISNSNSTHDAAILEIDVVPESDTLKFRYVFASEEYAEYVGEYNDAFALFISGPGIMGTLNIARVPVTNQPVTINNVNNGKTETGPCMNCGYYVSNRNGTTVEYDAFTRVFTATAVVIPCETYKLKIAIADANDDKWDSGVFLEAKSLRSNTYDMTASLKLLPAHTPPGMLKREADMVYEDCDKMNVRIKREGNLTKREAVKLKIEGTALRGVDYVSFPDSVVFQPGENVVSFDITPITDALMEGTESVKITLLLTNACTTQEGKSIQVYIRDPYPPLNLGPDTLLCPGDNYKMTAPLHSNVFYEWQDGTASTEFTATQAGTYYLKITNLCGKVTTDSVVIKYIPTFDFSLGKDTAICVGGSVTKTVPVFPYATYQWNTGSKSNTLTTGQPGTYVLTVKTRCQVLTDTFKIRYIDGLLVNLGKDTTVCEDEKVNLNAYARDVIDYTWQDGSKGSGFTVTKPGRYWVTVKTSCEMSTDTIDVFYLPKAHFDIGKDTVYCEEFKHKLDAGPDGVSYQWMPTGETSRGIQVSDYGTYTVRVINEYGCSTYDTMRILPLCAPVVHIPNAFTPNSDNLNEVFKPSMRFVNSFNFAIYNRWGEKVFESEDLKRGWDGRYKGVDCEIGVYYWVLTYQGIKVNKTIFGDVTLIR